MNNNINNKMITRREHGLKIKKPNKDLPLPMAVRSQSVQKRVQLNDSLKFCLDIIKEMFTKQHREIAWPFYEPVDHRQYPDYSDLIKKPMDLSTIKKNIETGEYNSVQPFVEDMRLMFTNCLRYNKPETPVIDQARKLRDLFEYRFSKMPEELLKERLSTNNLNNSHNNNHQNHKSSHKSKVLENSPTNSIENHQSLQTLETQVKLLANAMSALTGVKRVSNGSTTNGKRKRSIGRPKGSTSKRSDNSRAKKIKTNDCIDDEDDDSLGFPVVPSPVVFQYDDIEDLRQLKTDLENLDASDLKNILRILQTTEPSIKCDNEENIEIDFEILKPETLIALRKFVSSCMLNNVD